MTISDDIKNWEGKPKELVEFLTQKVMKDKKSFSQLVDLLKTGSDVEKGTSADVMKHITAESPEIAAPYIEELIGFINHKLPRVKWGVPEAIGNISKSHPDKVTKAIPDLLKNTKEDSTVVRWCASYALTEIAKNNSKTRNELIPIFNKIIGSEKNNGVKNVYVKAMKFIEKSK